MYTRHSTTLEKTFTQHHRYSNNKARILQLIYELT